MLGASGLKQAVQEASGAMERGYVAIDGTWKLIFRDGDESSEDANHEADSPKVRADPDLRGNGRHPNGRPYESCLSGIWHLRIPTMHVHALLISNNLRDQAAFLLIHLWRANRGPKTPKNPS
jgi:hypothetical protein